MEILEGAVIIRPNQMVLKEFYFTVLHDEPCLYRKISDNEMEVFGFTSRFLVTDLTGDVRVPADPFEAASDFIALAPEPMTAKAVKRLREAHPPTTATDDPATREFMNR